MMSPSRTWVIGAFEPHPAGLLGASLAAMRDEIGVGDGLGADEALFESL
jgi:hypothetical protein